MILTSQNLPLYEFCSRAVNVVYPSLLHNL